MTSEGSIVSLAVGLGMTPEEIKGSVCVPGMSTGTNVPGMRKKPKSFKFV